MTKPLLRFLLFLSAVCHDIAVKCGCSAFHAPPSAQSSGKAKLPSLQLPPTYTSCCKTDDARRRILSSTTPTTTSSSSTTVLFGYANVNDYFNSFQQNDDSSGSSESSSDDGGRSSWSPNKTPREFKYIGHGRIRSSSSDSDNNNGDDEAAEGGVFDINNYFSSFGQQQRNDEEVDSENDGSYEHQTDTSYYHEQPPPRQKLSMEQIIANNNARLCPKSFLTQAAIQSFIYLLEECRDPRKCVVCFLCTFLSQQFANQQLSNSSIHSKYKQQKRLWIMDSRLFRCTKSR